LPLAIWLLARTLERSSWRTGAAAGLVAALMALGRDQVALLGLYLLAALVVTHWMSGASPLARLRASVMPLAASTLAAVIVLAWPMLMTVLLAADSNRPGFSFIDAGRGSLHPAHVLTLAVPDLFGANDPAVPYWGPASIPWGFTDLFLAQNMGQLYAGALPLVAVLCAGVLGRGLLERDIRFLSVATLLALLYALGWYTPFFRTAFDLLPGLTLFRRPADASFVFGALLAILGGYCVHLWLTRSEIATKARISAGIVAGLAVIALAGALAAHKGEWSASALPLAFAALWLIAAAGALLVARCWSRPLPAALLLALFAAADLRWNNGPNESSGLPPATYDALRPDTQDPTVRLLKSRLAATAAPDRRDRVEMIGIAYHWPNLGLVHDIEHVFGHNPIRLKTFAQATGVGDTVAVPDQRTFAPLFPSYRSALADLLGLRFIATGVPVEQIDRTLAPGDLRFVARTPDAFVYENPRALPRAMLLTDWRQADFGRLLREGWPRDVDPRRTALLEHPPPVPAAQAWSGGGVRIVRYQNTRVTIDTEAPVGGLLLLNDVWHPWWRATLDGAPAPILRANVLFRGVMVPAGRHRVEFTFHPLRGAIEELSDRLKRR
ncbi:MAG: hypothetical protein IT538_04470, partial [Variibacter sp.]|nr:hypothetical protein [Variibacter sp.]